MSLYTCDIHGGSHHICGACAANDLARAEEAEVRLEDELRELERKLDDARDALAAIRARVSAGETLDAYRRLVVALAEPDEQLDRALAEVGR